MPKNGHIPPDVVNSGAIYPYYIRKERVCQKILHRGGMAALLSDSAGQQVRWAGCDAGSGRAFPPKLRCSSMGSIPLGDGQAEDRKRTGDSVGWRGGEVEAGKPRATGCTT